MSEENTPAEDVEKPEGEAAPEQPAEGEQQAA
jgi:hypothetical protein